jgi:DNA helicase HerA-like ATPase
LLFGGMGAGKSWTARYLVAQKVRAGHQVIVLDPHAASHEWKGIRILGQG